MKTGTPVGTDGREDGEPSSTWSGVRGGGTERTAAWIPSRESRLNRTGHPVTPEE